MKNISLKTIAILAVALATVGCIKETFPKGSTVTAGQLNATEYELAYRVNAIPGAMMMSGTAGYANSYGFHADYGMPAIHLMTECMLEDLTVMGELGYFWFGAFFQNLAQGSDYIYCAYFWDCYYAWIKLANDAIALAGEITDETDAQTRALAGQAHAYRAMFYLDLARLYEPKDNKILPISNDIKGLTVPIVTENTNEDMAENNGRASREDMYAFIFEDLALAEKYLDPTDAAYTNPTLAAVYGLYARAYLELGAADDQVNKTAYAEAAKYARKAIETSGKTPLTEAQWHDPKSGFNDGGTNNSWIWGLSLPVENASNIITNVAHLAPEATWGYSILSLPGASKAFYDQISEMDFRKRSWLDETGTWNSLLDIYDPTSTKYQFAGNKEALEYFHYQTINLQTGQVKPYINIKFRPAMGDCIDYTQGNCADHVLMRVEEMYFIEMEATLYTKGLAEARALLDNFMKTYRYPTYSSKVTAISDPGFLNEMLLQKRIEFWGEGILFFDYKRLNKGITRGYNGTNFPSVARFNCEGRSPQWNICITRGEFQSNKGIMEMVDEQVVMDKNNPDPTGKLPLWTE